MIDGLTERELLLYFALFWIGAVAVWILLDYLGNNWPKRRFRARGYRVPMAPWRRRHVVRSIRELRDEEVRETLESATGKSTLAVSRRRRVRSAERPRPWWWRPPVEPVEPEVPDEEAGSEDG